jgi:hypothetical protein
VVAFDDDQPPRREVAAVLDQARVWSHERRCRLTVTTRDDLDDVTAREA